MAGILKPANAGQEGEIKFGVLSSYNSSIIGYTDPNRLINGVLDTNCLGGAVFLNNFYQIDYITFTITQLCNIWAINGTYADTGGQQGNPIRIYELSQDGVKGNLVYTSEAFRDVDVWYKLAPTLKAGYYRLENALGGPRIEGGYCVWKEWYIESYGKFLYLNNNKLYSYKE